MKLPEDVVIPEDKLVRYLLLPREENDKSQFLGIAGYTLGTWEVLARDLHDLAKTYEISDKAISLYGIKWEVQGSLTGPNDGTVCGDGLDYAGDKRGDALCDVVS